MTSLIPVCSCGEILAKKVLIYKEEMKKVCDEMNIDLEMVSQGLADQEGEFKQKRSKIVLSLCEKGRICCIQNLITFTDKITLIRGN